MQYRKRKSLKTIKQTKRAIDVLYEKMEFYSVHATFIATEICKLLKESDVKEGKRLTEMHKQMMRFNDIAIDCAAKLAPYQSAKLQSIEVKSNKTVKYVIQAPMVVKDKNEWIRQVESVAAPLAITPRLLSNEIREEIDIDNSDDYEYSNTVGA